jgi:aminomethyltransferase
MRTPLFHEHEKLNARIVDFHGWEMPVWYTSIREEHLAVRRSAGLFDICHMGEIFISRPTSISYLDNVLTRNIASMKKGQALYTFLLNHSGGIIDDLIIYCLDQSGRFMLCVNSSNKDKDYAWMCEQNSSDTFIENKSDSYAALALQGPQSGKVLKECLGFDLESIRPFHFTMLKNPIYGELMISRTGYTGAGGVEFFFPAESAPELWRTLLASGATPCGLGARDILRLEMGYPLHGNDLSENTTPLEAGLEFAVDLKKPNFIGKQTLVEQQRQGIPKKLIGMELLDRGVPREGCQCLKDGKVVGIVTSGSISPITGMGIALGYLDASMKEGDEFVIDVRGKNLKSRIKKPPFVSGTL